ncbi:MAG: imidazole glycerol phosphate synthase subunit HisF [Spirochaetes bacterium GWD1_27_9]|nr:MAG: imidazole glycerol phosphate synthase subunit HisF [Spirochaetes bacterium GWC1_27_15]OHD30443.1 MAG: imidazole glycerol phosphate synthase subunit HisF [Spirochaetes bacterium GWD1_27_9]
MLTKRIIACLDVLKGQVTKAIQFQDNINIAPVSDVIKKLYNDGIDEVIFFDISASSERRKIDIDVVKKASELIFVPFTVGGGIKTVEDMYEVLKAGAEKISIDSMAVRNPNLITEGSKAFGSQCIVLSMQAKKVNPSSSIPSGYEIYIDGARVSTGMDAIEWAIKGEKLGAGELVINSIDCDGMLSGYDINLLDKICKAVNIPVIASGGAGKCEHVAEAFIKTDVSAAIVSSMLYSTRLERNFSIEEIKNYLINEGIPVRAHIRGD